MKKRIVVLSLLLLLGVVGCDTTSYQRVAMLENAVIQAEKISDELGVRLEDMEATLTETQAALNDPNLPADLREQLNNLLTQTVDGIKVVSAKRGEYGALITRLRKQIEEAKKEDMGFGDELILYGKQLKEGAKHLPGSVGGYATLAGIIFGAIGTVLARKRKGELTRAQDEKAVSLRAVAEIVHGIEYAKKDLMKADKANNVGVLTKALATTESTETTELVTAIRKKIS